MAASAAKARELEALDRQRCWREVLQCRAIQVRARPLPEAGLATYRVLEQRAAAMAPGWTIEVEPPVLPLPDLALDQDGAPANADSLALALWAAQRIGLPIDIAVRGDDHSPLVQPFADRGVDARLTDGASADRAALRWRVAE